MILLFRTKIIKIRIIYQTKLNKPPNILNKNIIITLIFS